MALTEPTRLVWPDSYGTPADHIEPDAAARIAALIEDGRRQRGLRAFLARSESRIAGSVVCQLQISPYPEVDMPVPCATCSRPAMQLRHLRYIVKIVDAGSISRAANVIHVA